MTKLVGRCLSTVWGTAMLTAWSCAQPAARLSSNLVRPVSEADRLNAQRRYGQLPLSFEANQGQTDERVQFLARGDGYSLFLTPTESVLALRGPAAPGRVLRMELLGGDPTTPATGLDELPGKSHYFVGNDPTQWRTNVPNYGKVRFAGVYPGVDLVYYGNQRQLEYDFVVAPGGDPSAIRLGFAGAERLEIDAQGELALQTPAGDVRWRKPVVYQEVGGIRQMVDGHYVRKGTEAVGFAVGPFDPDLPLVIDPVLVYSTYLGSQASGVSIAVDSTGSAYVTGATSAASFPTTSGAFMPQLVFAGDAYVAKMDPAGHALMYATYLGGNGNSDVATSIVVDAGGNAYATGRTNSSNFPTTLNAYKTTSGGGAGDAFVTKLDPSGSALLYSTYLGGGGDERGLGVAADSSGHAYVTGFTGSSNFPTLNAIQATLSGTRDAFVTKLDTNLAGAASLVYSTYLGGSLEEDGFGNGNQTGAIAVDTSGYIYVTGSTDSADFPTFNAFQSTVLGEFTPNVNAFIAKIDPNLSGPASLIYSTYFGTGGSELGTGIAVDSSGSAYVTGTAWSVPTTAGAFQVSSGGSTDAFVTKLTPDGSGLIYSTYLGGSLQDLAVGIAVDSSGYAYVTGYGLSKNFPISNAVQASSSGGADAFVTKLTPDGSGLVYSTYLGGSADDFGQGIAVDAFGAAYVTGTTRSTNFPVADPFQACCAGAGNYAFVSKIVDDTPKISIDDVTAVEGTGFGDTAFTFTVALSRPAAVPITVAFATADGTATLADYVSTSGTLTFNPGEMSKTVVVYVVADFAFEGTETFSVTLSHPSNAMLAKATGIGTILNDDDDSVSIDDASVVEGNSGLTPASIVLRLSQPHDVPVSVDVTASNGTATSPLDYFGFYDENEGLYVLATTVTFGAGEVTHTVPFYVRGDTTVEPDETVIFTLGHPTQVSIRKGTAALTILGDDVQLIAIDDDYVVQQDSSLASGAVPVKELPGVNDGGRVITELTNVNGTLFFLKAGLWKSDGTPAGTIKLTPSSSRDAKNLFALNGIAFFQGTDGVNGAELWRSDGTLTGTQLVKDISPGNLGSAPREMTSLNGQLFFVVTSWTADGDPAGVEIWKSDGTAGGTVPVKRLAGGVPYELHLISHSGKLFFDYGGLWTSDGTPEGTTQISDLRLINSGPTPAAVDMADETLFLANDSSFRHFGLWKTDGTQAGTTLVKNLDNMGVQDMVSVNGSVYVELIVDTRVCDPNYFPICMPLSGGLTPELWKTDGTPGGTTRLRSWGLGAPGAFQLLNFNGTLLFQNVDGFGRPQLWGSDGTPQGTTQIAGLALPPDMSDLTIVGGTLFFRGADTVSPQGYVLWKSDLTEGGTVPFARIDLMPQTLGKAPYPDGRLTNVNSVFFVPLVYVPPNALTNTLELWIAGDAKRLLANDTVLGHPTVTVSAASTPSHGTLLLAADGSFTYRPDAGFVGTDRFTYFFSGGGVTSNVATVTIHVTATHVTPVNHPPVLRGVPAETQSVSLGNSLTFQTTATDSDTADTLTFSLQGNVPSGATIDPQTGAFAWTPLAAQLGPYTFAVRVTDNGTPNLFDERQVSISVADTMPPVITAPPDVVVGTGPSGGAIVFVSDAALGTATASDNSGGPVTVTRQGVPPGNAFPVGTTTILYSGSDAARNTASAAQQVIVNDTTPPRLTPPANITTGATAPSGAAVTYSVTATDAVDGTVVTSCSPASGSLFVIGTTVVSCSATDAHANRATGSFTVTVNGAAAQTADLIGLVQSFDLAPGIASSLVLELRAALYLIGTWKPGACGVLTGVIREVNVQTGRRITPAQAGQLRAGATQIQAVIGCR